jgi:hypothetical protein
MVGCATGQRARHVSTNTEKVVASDEGDGRGVEGERAVYAHCGVPWLVGVHD